MSAVEWLWGLRTVAPDGRSRGGFVWPSKGRASAPDWDPTRRCGGGLHFLLWGVGFSHLLDWGDSALWQVVRAPADEVVDLGGKAKAPWLEVVYTGDRRRATDLLALHCPAGSGPIHGATVVAGDRGTAHAGDRGTAHAGDRGHATVGDHGTATAGDWGHARAGDRGTATSGYGGTSTAGYRGHATAGDRGHATVGYCGTAAIGCYATAGKDGTAAAGEGGTATAGTGGILVLAYYAGRRRLAVAYVGTHADGLAEGEVIEPHVAYRVEVVDDLPRWRRAEVAS